MTEYNPKIRHRRSIRLKRYDYSQPGLYFLTICVKNNKCLLGKILDRKMILNDAGLMINNEWLAIPNRFQNVRLHEYVIMPNHFHAIMEITAVGATLVVALNDAKTDINAMTQSSGLMHTNKQGQPLESGHLEDLAESGQPQGIALTTKPTVGDIAGAFQSITTVKYIHGVKNHNWPPFNGKLWQRNYYEHIIRNEKSFYQIVQYIRNNSLKWQDDRYYA